MALAQAQAEAHALTQAQALAQAHAQPGTLLAEALTTAVSAAELSSRLTVLNAELLERSTSMGVSPLIIGRWQNAIPGSGTAEERAARNCVKVAHHKQRKKRKASTALVD